LAQPLQWKKQTFFSLKGMIMSQTIQNIGFSYFSGQDYLVQNKVETWFPFIKKLGATQLVLESEFDRAVPEDVVQYARENGMEPIIHFRSELPLARTFNDVATILDAYAKWDVKYVILGDKPNVKSAWPTAGWHFDHLVDHFLDRFIPLADYVERISMNPLLPPMQPGGDYWDTAFLEMTVQGLKRRQMTPLLEKLCLASYGYTFGHPLSWGEGGPERWSSSKPYFTPDGQEDQLGFQNFEWAQDVVNKVVGKRMPMLILDAGNPWLEPVELSPEKVIESIQLILEACKGHENEAVIEQIDYPTLNGSILGCIFSLETIKKMMGEEVSISILQNIFKSDRNPKSASSNVVQKQIKHYLLLPAHEAGVSDVVLNKVRPIIKQLRPTIGFSLEEAKTARKVSVFPDSLLFTDDKIKSLRAAGCIVEVLPQTGIEIATHLKGTTFRN
jgi:hypothetical protein